MSEKKQEQIKNQLLSDSRFVIDEDFLDGLMKEHELKSYDVVKMRISDIKRGWIDGTVFELDEVAPYKYLHGDVQAYKDYEIANRAYCDFAIMTTKRFDALIASLESNGYDPMKIIVVDQKPHMLDGLHRACWLLKKFGPDYELDVLRIEVEKMQVGNEGGKP